MPFTYNQKKILAIIPRVTGSLSFLGSSSILYDIFSDHKRKLRRPYYRLILGMSTYDILSSFWTSLSTIPVPAGSPGVYGAKGTGATCTAQGFFVQFGIGSFFYNLMLSAYYLLLGRYQFSEEDIAKRWELYMHVLAVIPNAGMAIAGLPLTLYNNANLWCWIASYPFGCEQSEGAVECERGQNAWLYRWLFLYIPLWLIIGLITGMMILLTLSVRKEEKMIIEIQTQVRDSRPTDLTEADEMRWENNISLHHGVKKAHLERTRKLFHQAIFYVGAFFLVAFFPTINRLVQFTSEVSFPLMVLHVVFMPLHGLFNFLIYRQGGVA